MKEVLRWWLDWSRPSDAAKVYFRKLAATDEGLAILLEQYLGEKLSDDSRRQFIQSMYDRGLNEVEMLMSTEEVKDRVEQLAKKPGSVRLRRA